MKKLCYFILGIVLIGIISYFFLSFFTKGKMANKLEIPNRDIIYKMEITKVDENKESDYKELNSEDFESILKIIENSKPTRNQSINDFPTNIKQLYMVKISYGDEFIILYAYEKKSFFKTRHYLELPYNGIYEISKDDFNTIKK